MKKFAVFLIVGVVVGWGIYLVQKRMNRVVVNDYTERVRLEKELSDLQKKYDFLYKFCSSDSSESMNGTIERLRVENRRLRMELDQIKNPSPSKSYKTVSVKKPDENENVLPIARNPRAAELQKFLTDEYGNR